MENKKILITGGSRGIGKAIVESFLNQGHEVLTTCRDSSKFPFDNKLLLCTAWIYLAKIQSIPFKAL